jgi:hypothetical protein
MYYMYVTSASVGHHIPIIIEDSTRGQHAAAQISPGAVLISFILAMVLGLIALAAVFAYFGFRKVGNEVGRLPCSFHFFDDTRLTLSSCYAKYNSAHFHPFDRFLDISILAWNAYMISVIPQEFIWALQCDINEL